MGIKITNEDSELIRKKLLDAYFSIVDVPYGIKKPPSSYLIHQQMIGRMKRQNINNQNQSNMNQYNFQKKEQVNPLENIKQFYCDPKGTVMVDLGLSKKELPKNPELLKLKSGDIVILFPIDMLTQENVGIYFTDTTTFKMYDVVTVPTVRALLGFEEPKKIKRTVYCSIVGKDNDTLRITTVLNDTHHDKGKIDRTLNHKFTLLDMGDCDLNIPKDNIDWLKIFTDVKEKLEKK